MALVVAMVRLLDRLTAPVVVVVVDTMMIVLGAVDQELPLLVVRHVVAQDL